MVSPEELTASRTPVFEKVLGLQDREEKNKGVVV